MWNLDFPMSLNRDVAYPADNKNHRYGGLARFAKRKSQDYRDWYAINVIYGAPLSIDKNAWYYDMWNECMGEKFMEDFKVISLLRVKANFYPPADKLIEHQPHIDYDVIDGKPDIQGALYCINTCDGYTKLHDGTKIDSVANRLILFNSQKSHNSTNTTTTEGRWNININYL